ncbi:hypothetical protein DFQ29_006407 [Apophysomyces sp. BC1021]|nr:hypothetical protein DFQ29_006407 [Apophysomyces sp. BC1021]
MLEPISLRFRFHFESSKPTNRLDKPEWYLTHVKNTIATHIPFLVTTIQPIVDSASEYLGGRISVKDNFIKGLLANVSRKLQATIPKTLDHPSWMSHTIHEILLFDQNLQENFAYAPSDTQENNRIMASVVLGERQWFDAWFQAEKKFSLIRYDEIVLDSQAFDVYAQDELDTVDKEGRGGDAREYSAVKRTRSAVHLLSLIDGVTGEHNLELLCTDNIIDLETYKLIPSLAQRLRFLAEIQLSLLSQYHQRISSAIDSFEALSLIRSVSVPGALPDAVTGVMIASESGGIIPALRRLCRWWASARTIREDIRYWAEDDFFLSMQHEVNTHLSVIDEAGVRAILRPGSADAEEISLFSTVLIDFDALSERIEKLIISIIAKEWMTNARTYAKRDTWWQTSAETLNEISSDLYRPLQDLRIACNFLYSTLPLPDYTSVYRRISQEIEDWYWGHVITQNQFSKQGSSQLETDLQLGFWKTGRQWIRKPENYTKRLKETLKLLVLTFNTTTTDHDNSETQTSLTYDTFMKALVDTSQKSMIQEELDRLGIEVLNYNQIRDVLRRRSDTLCSWN